MASQGQGGIEFIHGNTPTAAPQPPTDTVHGSQESWQPSAGVIHELRKLLSRNYKAQYAQYVAERDAALEQKAIDIADYYKELIAGIRRSTQRRTFTVTVTHVKGGVAKTTTSGYLASTLGETARKTVTLIDNNPMWGTTARLLGIPSEDTLTVRSVHAQVEKGAINSHSQFVGSLGSNKHNVSLIASDAVKLREELYDRETAKLVITTAQQNSIFVVNDTSNNIGGGDMQAALELSDVVVIPCIPTSNGIEGTAITMSSYEAWGHSDKMPHAIVVVSKLPAGRTVEDYRIQLGLSERQVLIGIPDDPRLEADSVIDLDQTDAYTRLAYLELVYAVARIAEHVQEHGYQADPLRLVQGRMVSIPSGNSPELPYVTHSQGEPS